MELRSAGAQDTVRNTCTNVFLVREASHHNRCFGA
ncbi:MAG: hypothetical protein JWQ76_2887 [Ramlibacter sp.]|nr:hypothetical protein [Ramlibacter sp.]